MIIGIVSALGAGKDEVAKYLVLRGATHVSLSTEILKEIKKRKIPVTRRDYVEAANDLREKIDHGILAKRAFGDLKIIPEFTVVSSIRHPGEAKVVLSYPDSHILAVSASPKIRFSRVCSRAREGDIKTWSDFLAYDKEALKGKNPAHQQIGKSLELANLKVENNGSIGELHLKLDGILKQIQNDVGG